MYSEYRRIRTIDGFDPMYSLRLYSGYVLGGIAVSRVYPAGTNIAKLRAERLAAMLTVPTLMTEQAPVTAPEVAADVEAASHFPEGFIAWARHWRFVNRESGGQLTFRTLWPGQQNLAQTMIEVARHAITPRDGVRDWQGLFALKAGKLGFTELECCWDGYVLWSRRNGRVHLFSKEETAAKHMLTYVKYGLKNMEPAWRIRFLDSSLRETSPEVGTKEFRITVLGPDGQRDYGDVRLLQAFATGNFPAIDQSCQHAHVDEWAHMEHPGAAWGAINTTIAPGGTCHIVTRGAGEDKEVEDTWKAAVGGVSKLRAFFAPWSARSDRDRQWYEEQAASSPTQAALAHYAAETPEDAFLGDEDNDFVPIEIWDRRAELICCASGHYRDAEAESERFNPAACPACARAEASGEWHSYLRLHPLRPGLQGPEVIVSVDAGVTRDNFAVTGTTRHPLRPDDPALRVKKLWRPEDFEDGIIDFATAEAWLRTVCLGACPLGHPTDEQWKGGKGLKPLKGQAWAPGDCPACLAGEYVPPFNVYEIVFDRYQLTDMMQRLKRDGVTWIREFDQGGERMAGDRTFYDVILNGRLGHTGDEALRTHVNNAKAKTQKDEESKLRIIKKAPHRPVDLAVSAAMGVAECLRLNL